MTREDVKKQFPEATDEQITAILNQHNNELQGEKNKVSASKAELDRLKGVESEYETLKNQNLTDAEKLEKEVEKAAEEKAKYIRMQNRIEVEKILVQAGLTEEDYKDYIDNLVSEDLEASKKLASGIVTTISKKAEKAGKDKESELLDDMDDDKGGKDKDGKDDEELSDAEKFAKSHAERVSGSGDVTTDVLNHYLGGNE